MQFLRQSTAVDVGIGPFVDQTDGFTAETGLTLAQADIRLKKNNGAWAQKNDVTSAAAEENGWYECELDATDTNTVGILILAVNESGALPVWHEYYVLEEVIFDALFASGANAFSGAAGSTTLTALAAGSITAAVIATDAIDADAIAANAIDAGAIATGAITAAKFAAGAIDAAAIADGAVDAATFAAGAINAAAIADNAIDAGAIAADAITAAKIANGAIDAATFAAGAIDAAAIANGAIDAATFAAGAIDAAAIADGAIDAATFAAGAINAAAIAADAIGASELAADAVAEIADAVWDEAIAGHLGAGSTGLALNSAGAAGDPWSTALPGAYGAGTAGNIVGNNLDAAVSSRASQASVDTIDDFLDTEIAAILTVVNRLDTAIELDGAVYRFTANALELAPSGGLDAAGVRAAVGLAAANLDTQLAAINADTDAIEVDTQDIQSRLPAALVGGRMNSNVSAVNGLQVQGTGVLGDEWRPV